MKRLIVTADDFGLAPEVNEAVEQAHVHGILSATSLMVGEQAAQDAVLRARRLPGLKIGLHLTLVEGTPVSPPDEIPDLIDGSGRFRTDLAPYGFAIMTRPSVRRQVRREIRAQFEAFRATGLPLDHVNAHQHYHLHPAILSDAMAIGRDYGLKAIRVPVEPAGVLRAVEKTRSPAVALVAAPWSWLSRWRARQAGLAVADRTFGLAWSGAMTETRLAELMDRLEPGSTEIYLHPATANAFEGSAQNYRYREELSALLAAGTKDALARSGAVLSGYADIEHDPGERFAPRTERIEVSRHHPQPVAIAATRYQVRRPLPGIGEE